MQLQARSLFAFLCSLCLLSGSRVLFGTSVNAVAYVNLPLSPGFSLIANPLLNIDNRISYLFTLKPLPDGATVYLLQPDGYLSTRYDALTQQWTPADVAELEIPPGEGFFFFNPTSSDFTITFVGEVMQGTLINPLPRGYSLQSSIVPQAGTLDLLQFPAEPGDCIYTFNSATQKYKGYFFDEFELRWIPEVPRIQVGEGFFVRKARATEWLREFSVTQP